MLCRARLEIGLLSSADCFLRSSHHRDDQRLSALSSKAPVDCKAVTILATKDAWGRHYPQPQNVDD